MASKPIRGRRAAQATTTAGAPVPDIEFGASAERLEVVEDGQYDGTVTGARYVTSKSGAVSVVLSFKTDDGTAVKLQPLLVKSSAGDTSLVLENRAILADIAGLDGEKVNSTELLKRLTGATCWVQLSEVVDRDGRPINRIDDGEAA